MDLSELTAYAGEKFHIQEQHKWADFPGFSVLAKPNTGKWLALLMRQWDFDTGTEIQRCDIKCGQETLLEQPKPYLSQPFRMKGKKWIGLVFDEGTEPEVVFRLFDRAVYSNEERGYTIVLETPPTTPAVVYQNTVLPAFAAEAVTDDPDVPEKIRRMMRLYEYQDNSFEQKCRNFYRQGKFMEAYVDDAPWEGAYRHYFPTYHDLTIRQLRGYFTWRTHVRKGEFLPIATSLAYIYVYELLNGIGTEGPEDTLEKLRAFETGFLDSGIGSAGMRNNLHRWMLEYSVLHNVPPELARKYGKSAVLKRDAALAVLKNPKDFGDEAVFDALCALGGEKIKQSPVVKKNGTRGRRLFAAVWRSAWEQYGRNGGSIFSACFGTRHISPWYPLSNAVYWEEKPHRDADYTLNTCRAYRCRGGVWQEERYDKLYFHQDRLKGLLHEADRILRKYLKTGYYLREKPEEAWATPYGEAAVRMEQQGELEAARPKISLDLSSLEQIRKDANITRDSLLTEEEMEAPAEVSQEARQPSPPVAPAAGSQPEPGNGGRLAAPDALHSRILLALLRGEPIEALLKAGHLMPSVVADTINEALFDEIGDNVLECDGDTITLVEDYRDEILQYMEAEANE